MPSVGITTYNYAPADLLELARAADELGFDGLWFGEHYVIPGSRQSAHPGLAHGETHDEDAIVGQSVRIYDPWFLLGAIAGATRTLKIGTAICIAPMLHPLYLARASATAHDVSGGRFRLGLGAGWLKEEFDAFDIPFETRGARLDESIAVLRAAWQGGFFSHTGKNFEFGPLQITPHPVNVPLVCGGNSGPALRRVVRVADAWMNSAMVSLEEAISLRDTIEAELKASPRAGQSMTYFIRPQSPDAATVNSFRKSGFEDIVLWGPHVWPVSADIPLEEKRRGLAKVARELGVAVQEVSNERV